MSLVWKLFPDKNRKFGFPYLLQSTGLLWTDQHGSQIISDTSFWIADYFGSFILDRLSESDYNDTAISRPFIFDRVEERAIE